MHILAIEVRKEWHVLALSFRLGLDRSGGELEHFREDELLGVIAGIVLVYLCLLTGVFTVLLEGLCVIIAQLFM